MRVRRGVIVVAALVAAWVVPAPAGADVDNEARVSGVPSVARTFDGPAAVVDPANDDNIFVASADLLANTCHIFRSTDGGESFTELDGPDFRADTDCGLNKGGIPQNQRMKLTFDREGVLYWVLAVANPAQHGARSVVLARSSDQGDTWTTTKVAPAQTPATPLDAVANFVPDVFVSPNGPAPRTVWVSWRRSYTEASEKPTEAWAAKSTDGGQTFGAEFRAMDKNPGFDSPRIVEDAEATVYWFQRERPASGAEGEPPKPSPLLMARSTDGGSTWAPGEVGQEDVVMEEPLAAVSSDGRVLYLAWADGRNGDLDVFFMQSSDGGETWSEPLRVNDDPVGNKKTQKWPRMSVAANGRIDLAWYDYRHDAADTPEDDVEFFLGDTNDVYLASSDDGGQSFGENIRMTASSIDRTLGTYNVQYFVEVPPALGSGSGGAYVAWSDTRLGNADNSAQDIFGAVGEAGDDDSSVRLLVLAVEIAVIVVGLVLLAIGARRRRGGGGVGPTLSAGAT
ncbi:MAG: exo-alpha-sialidase [Acidimicrobiales bacterium]